MLGASVDWAAVDTELSTTWEEFDMSQRPLSPIDVFTEMGGDKRGVWLPRLYCPHPVLRDGGGDTLLLLLSLTQGEITNNVQQQLKALRRCGLSMAHVRDFRRCLKALRMVGTNYFFF